MTPKQKAITGIIVFILIVLLFYVLFFSKKAEAAQEEEEEDEGTTPSDGAPINGDALANKVEKVDTRYENRWDYHRAVYTALRNKGIPVIAAKMMTAHASKAQRGWKNPNSGKLWNYNCYGIHATPNWQKSKPYFVSDTAEYDATNGYYHTTAAFCSYSNLDACIDHYISLLRSERYQPAYMFAISTREITLDEMIQWARLLRSCGYFTADATVWGTSVWNIYQNIVRVDLGGM